uniref:Cupin 2 conserved barrel domain-containing protein n=1 Tax=viral metagenome TaxID=1070528 RepID=A0A6C0JGG9_9ZZZZ
MESYITVYEYENNVNPKLNQVPIRTKNINECETGITFIDCSNLYNVDHLATSPNLLASFIKVNDSFTLSNVEPSLQNSSSNLFFVLQGNSQFIIDGELFEVMCGEIIVTPCFKNLEIVNREKEEVQIYYINDSPLLNYLGSNSSKKIFKTAVYDKEFLMKNLNELSNPNNNRKGILLSNTDTEKIGVNTVTPILWALYNELPPNTVQKPHRHNSVALDLCISCEDSENIYTLVGEKLDADGNIVDPIKVKWKQSEMFITPPGLWHSHNNTGNSYAYILPIQDAGLLLYQRILGIELN